MTMDASRQPDGPPTMGGVVSKVKPSVPSSPLGAALDRVGDRWSLLLVERLLDGPARFNDLLSGVPGIAPNILSERLRRLERGPEVPLVAFSAGSGGGRAGPPAGRVTARRATKRFVTTPAARRSRHAGTAPPASEASLTARPPRTA